jgi:sulfatase maturation enzyme AslB (radical SAM superfamily)
MTVDPSKPITELKYPEFYDVAINNRCNANCPWCYVNAKETGKDFAMIVDKIDAYFGSMSENERPFQVAIGGAGEPTLHPKFIEVLQKFHELGIVPNYTTNGMSLSDDIIEATKKYSGGVAVSAHDHLDKYWKSALDRFIKEGIRTNLHVIISDRESVDKFLSVYEQYKGKVEYFVLLPYMIHGRAKAKELDFNYLFEKLKQLGTVKDIAFGANFYPYLVENDVKWLDVSIYEPEILSKYLVLDDMSLYSSSFSDDKIIQT